MTSRSGAAMPIVVVVRQHADQEGREAHDRERHEERDLAADEVADAGRTRGRRAGAR